jgi:hypothetical protein
MAPEDAWRDVQALLSWKPHPINVELLNRARVIELKYRLSWWDSQIVAAAQAQGCQLLLTEDLQDGAIYDSVVARNPFPSRLTAVVGGRGIDRKGPPQQHAPFDVLRVRALGRQREGYASPRPIA